MRLVLTKSQWARISELLGNLGLLTIATIVLPYILDKPNSLQAVKGVAITIGFWYISLIAARKS